MIKQIFKVLLAYFIGILVSLFLSIPLAPLADYSVYFFSAITGLIAITFTYSEIWKSGKYDAIKKNNSIKRALGCITGYVIITLIVELIVILSNKSIVGMMIGTLWFYPFTAFINKDNFVTVTLIIMLVFICMSILAYNMGVKRFSLWEKILNARKKKFNKKAEKHFAEIEKIKEEYRNK